MGGHRWATGIGVQCTEHAVEREDFEFEHEFLEAQVPLCVKCWACQKCEPDDPCRSEEDEA